MELFQKNVQKQIKLSIIIPMYNVEEYINDTLNSMRSIEGYDIEIILIDDGSTDDTLNIAQKWAEVNSNLDVLILAKENEGPSIARNIGILKARGDFITFFDSDDIALSYLYKEIIEIMNLHTVDICIFRGASFDQTTQDIYEFPDHSVWRDIMGGEMFKVLTPQQEPRIARLEPSAVVRVYRKNFILKNEISFPEKVFFEDISFHVKSISNANKIALLDKTLLLYRVNREGQTTGSFGRKRFDILKINEIVLGEFSTKKIPENVLANFLGLLMVMNVWCVENCKFEDKKEFLDNLNCFFSKVSRNALELYKNEYAQSEWERNVCKAFIDKNEKVMNILSLGGYPTFNEEQLNNINDKQISLNTIDDKLEHLFSQQKDGWAHDRFNVINQKLENILAQQRELKDNIYDEVDLKDNSLKPKKNLLGKLKSAISILKRYKG